MDFKIIKTEFAGYGIRQKNDDVYVCITTKNKSETGLKIYNYDFKVKYSIKFDPSLSTGDVFCVLIKNLNLSGCYLRITDGKEEYADSHSEAVYGLGNFGEPASRNNLYTYFCDSRELKGWSNDSPLKTAYSDSIFCIAHPRGLTMLDSGSEDIKGTFKAIEKNASDIKKSGITGLILMPVYERIENEIKEAPASSFRMKEENEKINYWGFGPGFYYAPKKSFSFSEINDISYEFKSMVLNLHKKGIEVILTFDFNNLPYYEVADILRYWIFNYHIDGFRIFGVNEVYKLINDPFFKDTKLMLENYTDIPTVPSLYKNIGVFDDEFKTVSRKYLKGDDDCVGRMSYYVRENHNNYAAIRNITDFDGFTLADLVTYDSKHNELNNEDNEDGTNYNHSWNCGEEGKTDKKAIQKLRVQQIKNAICLIMLSQGTPVISAGDDILNTQEGNNNPYCQDNEIGWVKESDDKAVKEIKKFMKDIIAFRQAHAILHQPAELKLFDYMSCKLPDVSFHGEEAWQYNSNPESRQFAVLYAGQYAKQYTGKQEPSVFVVYNMHWEERDFALPILGGKSAWKLVCRTDLKCDFNPDKAIKFTDKTYTAKGRTISVFISSSN